MASSDEPDKNKRNLPTMPTVLLRQIAEEMQMQSDLASAYLNVTSGEVVLVSEESFIAAERGDDTDPVSGESLDEVRAIAAGEGYLQLPSQFEINEYDMMERFARSLEDQSISNRLHSVLKQRRPFRRFKDAVLDLDIANNWYEFRNREYERIAAEWCDEN